MLTRWGILVRKAVDNDDNERLQEVIALVGEARVNTAMPKQRLTLDKSTFREVMFALCGSDNALLSLKKIGAVRGRGDNFELWAADAALKDKLKQENWRKVTTRLGTTLMGLPMERMRPWLVFASLTRTLAPSGASTMDQHFLAHAKSSKKQLAFLETVADQLQLLDRAITSRVLDDMLSDLRRARVMVHDLIKAYRNGNFSALEKAVFDPTEVAKHREMYRLMFDKRNQAWLPQIVTVILPMASAILPVGPVMLASCLVILAMGAMILSMDPVTESM